MFHTKRKMQLATGPTSSAEHNNTQLYGYQANSQTAE